jgi:recombination protein RecA
MRYLNMAKTLNVGDVNMADKNADKEKALDTTITQIEKQFGKGSIMKLGDQQIQKIPSIPTGSLALDIALGIGGMPRGRVCEVYGNESSGKTTLALHIVAQAQKAGGIAAFIDAEHAMDPNYAKMLGVDIENLLISQPDSGEQALEITEQLVRSGAVDIIVIDSVAALVPKAEIEGDMGDAHMGVQARLMSQALRKLTGIVSKTKTNVLFINQIRSKIGVMFGNPETTTGGNALKFYSSVRLNIRKSETLKRGKDDAYGIKVKVNVVKNKVAPPFKKVEFDILFDHGISHEAQIIDCGVEQEIVQKAGTWYSYGDDKLGQGKDNSVQFLLEHPDIAKEIEIKIREKLNLDMPDYLNSAKNGKDDSKDDSKSSSKSSSSKKSSSKSKKSSSKKSKDGDDLI